MLLNILVAVLVFGFLIFIHELGHFSACKAVGVQVNEFAIGMGPALLQKQKGETTYSLRLFPFGGFVAMEGEDEESNNLRAFNNAKLGGRILILSAGALMNLLLGFVLVCILTSQLPLLGITQVASFAEDAVSSQWLRQEDTILRMNGHRVRSANDVDYELMRDRDGRMDIEVSRGGEAILLTGVQFALEDIGDGTYMIYRDFNYYGVLPTFATAAGYAVNWSVSLAKSVWGSLMDLIGGRFGLNQLSGPVGVTKQIGEVSSSGNWMSLILLVALISINLGVMNLLPLPALDGGRLLFLLIELFRRKPVPAKYEGWVHTMGFVLLMGFMLVVTFKDIWALFV